MWKHALGAFVVALALVAGAWWSLVASYESDLGTDNEVSLTVGSRSTQGTEDILATLAFQGEAEDLAWSSLEVTLDINGTTVPCGFGSQSIASGNDALFRTKLGADGQTFTATVDATDEASFTHISLSHQRLGNETNHTLRFSSTDIFVANGVRWAFLEGVSFTDVKGIEGVDFSNNTDDRLDWYEYDLSVHRITPVEGVYLFESNSMVYKVQFVSYYNENDERRYPTFLVAALQASAFPALQDPTLVSPAPCLILAGDDDVSAWNATETVRLVEHNTALRSGDEPVSVKVVFEGVEVRIVENTPTEPTD
jgi:hypothetical protein